MLTDLFSSLPGLRIERLQHFLKSAKAQMRMTKYQTWMMRVLGSRPRKTWQNLQKYERLWINVILSNKRLNSTNQKGQGITLKRPIFRNISNGRKHKLNCPRLTMRTILTIIQTPLFICETGRGHTSLINFVDGETRHHRLFIRNRWVCKISTKWQKTFSQYI